jgi:hypothetical protein
MSETNLPPGPPSGAFNAAEQNFFQQGEALESGELVLDELMERRRRPFLWRPRLILVGVAACVAVVGLSLIGGRRPTGDAVAAVNVAPPAMSVPATSPPVDPAAGASGSVAASASDEGRAAKAKKIKPHAHHRPTRVRHR